MCGRKPAAPPVRGCAHRPCSTAPPCSAPWNSRPASCFRRHRSARSQTPSTRRCKPWSPALHPAGGSCRSRSANPARGWSCPADRSGCAPADGHKTSGTRVVPAQAHAPLRGKSPAKTHARCCRPARATCGRIPVEIRQQQHVEPGQIVRDHRERHTGKIYAANGKLFPHLLFRAVLAVRLDLNDHLAPGLLLHKVCKILRACVVGYPAGWLSA